MTRVVAEITDNKIYKLKVSDVKKFRKIVGEDVLDLFCCCFLQVDRISSLVSFMHLSEQHLSDSIAAKRNRLTICWFLIGTLKELGLQLKNLKAALVKRRMWDQTSWMSANGLVRWEMWSDTQNVSLLRNEMAFHISQDRIQVGMESIPSGEAAIFCGDSGKQVDNMFELATDALLLGLQKEIGVKNEKVNIEEVLKSLGDYVNVLPELEKEFLRILKLKDLEPIRSRVKGTRVII